MLSRMGILVPWPGMESVPPAVEESEVKVLLSWVTLCDPTDCNLPGFSVLGILQARTLE